MNMNEDWDVEQHKIEHEPDEHWELRRKFLLTHKDKYSEDILVCLAQVFINVELLGCRYPTETMELIAELSHDVAAEYREKQKKKLKRTFVQASEAASSKVKGHNQSTTITRKSIPNKHPSDTANQVDSSCEKLATEKLFSNVKKKSSTTKSYKMPNTQESSRKSKINDILSFGNNIYGNIILWERPNDSPQNVLSISADISGANVEWKYTKQNTDQQKVWECSIYLNSKKLACCSNFNKKNAKNEAATSALDKLRKYYYTIKVKQNPDQVKSNMTITKEIKPQTNIDDNDWKKSDCIGNKMMKMMGWMGGGLGKSEQGVVEPMSLTLKSQINRKGLGLNSDTCATHEMKVKCQNLFKDFLKTDMQNNIVFLDFTNIERVIIHQVARTMGLKSRSYGPSDKRKLIVSRKIDARNLLSELKSLGGITEKYELVEPTDKKSTSSST